jgi:hypothetical protein
MTMLLYRLRPCGACIVPFRYTLLLATMTTVFQVGFAAANELAERYAGPSASFSLRETGAPRSKPALRFAQSASNLTLSVEADSKKNSAFIKADDQFHSYVYDAATAGGTIKIQLASRDILAIWKGNGTIKELGYSDPTYFEAPEQFAPVFIVAEVRNDGAKAAQVTNAYLDVSESSTDLQPYLEIGDWSRVQCGKGTYDPQFDMRNLGWGPVNNGRLVYTFGGNAGRSPESTTEIGSFEQQIVASVENGLRSSGVNIERVKTGTFKCPSKTQIPACLARLKETGILGGLANYVYTEENKVRTDAAGSIQYVWLDNNKNTNHRASPFRVTVPLLFFDVGAGPECGAPGPVDRDEKPVQLSLDRRNYRISLDWHWQIKSRQVSRFALSLAVEKSSHHILKLVLALADGNSLSSDPIDITYFTPRMPPPAPDNSDDNK